MASERKDDYVLGKGYSASSRLNLQHCLFKWLTNGWLLHPSIPTTGASNLKIADVATGTGIWPIELSQTLPSSTQIDGFDISDSEFPPKEFLPNNVTLSTFDALAPNLPAELRERYDVVHIRLVALVVRRNDPSVLVRNLVDMLKPGDYIQWDEGNPTTLHHNALPPSTPSQTPAFTLLNTQMRTFTNHFNLFFTWIPALPSHLTAAGIVDPQLKNLPIPRYLLKPWTDQMLMALEELSYGPVFRVGDGEGVAGYGSGRELRALLGRCYEESRSVGAWMNNDYLVVWGRKEGGGD